MNLLNKLKEANAKGFKITINEEQFNKALRNREFEGIDDLSLKINGKLFEIEGVLTKIKTKGTVILEPVEVKGRTLIFKVIKVKPVDFGHTRKLLNRPPLLSYNDAKLYLDLNQLEKAKKYPVGNIKSYSIEDDKVHVYVGL